MSFVPIPPTIPASIQTSDITSEKIKVDELECGILNVTNLDVTSLDVINLDVTNLDAENLEVTSLLSNTITCTGTVIANQFRANQYLINSQQINAGSISQNALYSGSEIPFVNGLLYKTATFYQAITPVTGTALFDSGTPSVELTNVNGVGTVHVESRISTQVISSSSPVAHNFIISIDENTAQYTPGPNAGNGMVTITINPTLAGGEEVEIRWFFDGKILVVVPN